MSEEHHNKEHSTNESTKEEIKIDFSGVKKFFKNIKKPQKIPKWTKPVLIILLIAIAIFISSYYRMYPAYLPGFDDQARFQVENQYKNQIAAQIQAGNPNLPQAQLLAQTEEQFKEMLKSDPNLKTQIDSQSKQIADNSKAQMQNDKGQTYLLAIDPYMWYSYAKWYERTGFYGNEIVDGKERMTLRNGRIGKLNGFIIHPWFITTIHNILTIFNPSQDIFASTFLTPVLLIGLGIIPAFFLGRKFGGNTGGFFSAVIFALSPAILGRTAAGFSDTDAYTFIFPFLLIWLFIESVEAKNLRNNIIFTALAGLSVVLFKYTWGGWWFTFDLLLGLVLIFILYKLIILKFKKKEKLEFKNMFKDSKNGIIFFFGLIIFSLIFVILIASTTQTLNIQSQVPSLITAPLEPLNFIFGFKGAASGVTGSNNGLNYPLWPNVFTTVAELNKGTSQQIIGQAGGLTFVILGILGVIFLLFKKKNGSYYPLYGIILGIWMASTYYAGLVGVRFIALFSPVVGFGIAGLVGGLTGSRMTDLCKTAKINPNILKGIIVILAIFLILIPQFNVANQVAKSEVPSFDDTWHDALQTINQNSSKAIITSWWDFGHWFESMSDRTVTFDGGDQGKRIHWVGLSLLTSEEDESVDILKMLNCGQESNYDLLEKYLGDKYTATKTLKQIIREDKSKAKQTLISAGLSDEQSDEVLALTHCSDLYDMYLITSGDMVGKAGVWGHFGSWDFNRAYIYYNLKNKPIDVALKEAQTKLGLSQEESKSEFLAAQKIVNEDQANQWISPWPNYATQNPVSCVDSEGLIGCEYNVNLGNQNGIQVLLWRGLFNKTDISKSQLFIKAVNPSTGAEVARNPTSPNAYVVV
ncbi:hypothetical protein K9M18_04185, partial [Candidatus Woesearchaeota archaeon]|nr:hypothetical protein [Candidatus Woesearchaeota archaeon]